MREYDRRQAASQYGSAQPGAIRNFRLWFSAVRASRWLAKTESACAGSGNLKARQIGGKPETRPAVGIRSRIFFLDFSCVPATLRSEEHTSELQSRLHLVCRLLLEKKKKI